MIFSGQKESNNTDARGESRMLAKIADIWQMNRDLSGRLTWRSLMTMNGFRLRRWRKTLQPGRIIKLGIRRPRIGTIFLREFGSDPYTFQEVIVQNVYKEVLAKVDDCKAILDIGANVGLASRVFAAHYPAAKIVAVEPNPDTHRMLLLNLQPLIAENCARAICAAVWSRNTFLQGHPDEEDPALADRFQVVESAASAPDQERIVGISMDNLMAQSGFAQVDLLKIDVEGAEVELLSGSTQWLSRVNAVAIEFHGDSRKRCDFDGLMRRFGFHIVSEGRHTVLAVRKA